MIFNLEAYFNKICIIFRSQIIFRLLICKSHSIMTPENDLIKQGALYRMNLSEEFTKFLRKTYDLFGEPECLIGKNLTKTAFWFYIDSLYFYLDSNQDLKLVKDYMSGTYQPIEQFQELEDLQFILKTRTLISQQKLGTLNLADIRSSSIDEVIQANQKYLANITQQNANKIDDLTQKYNEQRFKIVKELDKFNIKHRCSHPMFIYEELEGELRKKWMEESQRQMNKEKCFLCSFPNKLISCKNCSLKVHPACYPTFTHRIDSKTDKPSQQQLKSFQCQNCINKTDTENEKCQLCCCVGGNFVKTSFQEQSYKTILHKENLSEENVKTTHFQLKIIHLDEKKKSKYIHLACFIWNSELKWNNNTRMVEGLNKIIRKKSNGMCSLCGLSFGSTIPCSNDTCRRFYHAQCAKRHNLEMNLIRAKTSVIELNCERHRHLNKHESIEQAQMNKFKDVKKMFEGVDKQIKRLNVSASYQQIKLIVERDYCSVCGKEEGWQKITICKQCRKWYHNGCSINCKNCV